MKHKLLFTAMLVSMAATYGVESVAEQFTVNPTTAQKLVDKLIEQETLLQKINNVPVDELKGQKVIGSVTGLHAKRTNTAANDRVPQDVISLGSKDYELFKTEFDTFLTYAMVDTWAKFPDLKDRYRNWVLKAIALTRVQIGWYGTHAATVTDSTTYPLNQDVNKGWLQHLREYNGGAQWFEEGATANEIRIGAGGDFENLDSAVHALLQMINPVHRKSKDLVVFIGDELLAAEQARLYASQGRTPSEKERIANILVTKTYANLPAETPTGFPGRGLMITSYSNLSIYWQETSWRRSVIDNPKRDRVEDYNSVNEGYVIEDEEKAAGFEFANVKIKEGNSWV